MMCHSVAVLLTGIRGLLPTSSRIAGAIYKLNEARFQYSKIDRLIKKRNRCTNKSVENEVSNIGLKSNDARFRLKEFVRNLVMFLRN